MFILQDSESAEAASGIARTTLDIYVIRVERASPGDELPDVGVVLEAIKFHVWMCDAFWTGFCAELKLRQRPQVHIRSVSENPDGTGDNKAFTKSPSTKN